MLASTLKTFQKPLQSIDSCRDLANIDRSQWSTCNFDLFQRWQLCNNKTSEYNSYNVNECELINKLNDKCKDEQFRNDHKLNCFNMLPLKMKCENESFKKVNANECFQFAFQGDPDSDKLNGIGGHRPGPI